MSLSTFKSFIRHLSVTVLFSASAFTIPSAEAGKGQIIVEVLQRILKNSDEVAKKSDGGIHGASPQISKESIQRLGEARQKEELSECVIAAEQNRADRGLTELVSLQKKNLSGEKLMTEARRIESELSRAFCYEIIKCNAAVMPEYSTVAEDFTNCIANEQSKN